MRHLLSASHFVRTYDIKPMPHRFQGFVKVSWTSFVVSWTGGFVDGWFDQDDAGRNNPEMNLERSRWPFSSRADPGTRSSGVISSGRCERIDFAEISSEPKCMPKAQRLLIMHPGAIFFKADIAPRF